MFIRTSLIALCDGLGIGRPLVAALALSTGATFAVYAEGANADDYSSPPDAGAYEKAVQRPACDYIIDNVAKWQQINSPSYRVFCVTPGNYTAAGIINVTTSGTSTQKRWLRYYNPSIPETTHPYHIPVNDRVIVRGFVLSGASHWVFDRLTVDAGNAKTLALLTASSNHNLFNQIDGFGFTIGFSLHNGSSYNTVQKSTLHDSRLGYDAAAVSAHGWNYDGNHPVAQPQYNVMVSNEVWNVNDGFQLLGHKSTHEDYRGTVVYNNDFYLTSERYTDCNGNYKTSGDCACAENALDLKSGSDSADYPVIIAHNRMWGFRQADTTACPTLVDPGTAIVQHQGTDNVKLQGNVIWDSRIGYFLSYSVSNVEFTGNLIHAVQARTDRDPSTALYITPAGGVTNLAINDNVFTQHARYPRQVALVKGEVTASPTFSFAGNTLISSDTFLSDTTGFKGTAVSNRYYDADKPSWDTNAIVGSADEAGYEKFCFDVTRITAPTQLCLAASLAARAGSIPAPTGLTSF